MKALLACLACVAACLSQVSAGVINYRGRISVSGGYVDGIGRFKFALVDEHAAVVWSSSEIPLSVSNGAYAVRLGDSAQAPAIPETALGGKTPAKLRIWFQREGRGWSLVGPDVALSDERPDHAKVDGDQGAAILAELHEIHALLSGNNAGGARPSAPEIVTVSIAGAPSLGSPDAPLALVEFTDFQCAYCIKFENEVFGILKRDYVDQGKLRIVSRNLPLPMHANAEAAARAAFCAGAQGKYWEMRERLLAANGALTPEAMAQIAQAARLEAAPLDQCAADVNTAAAVRKEAQEANAAGIDSTPTFVLGKVEGDKVTGLKIVGAHSSADFESEINKQLSSEAGEGKP